MPRLPVSLTIVGLVAAPVVAMAAWTSPPVDLSAPGQSADDTFGSVDAGGGTVAYWMRSDGTTRRAQASRRVGGTWTAPVDLSPPGVDVVGMASPAGGQRNVAFAGWQSEAGGVRTSSAVTLRGGSWSAPTDLGSGPVHDWSGLRIAANATGDAVAVWNDKVGANVVVDLARYSNGVWSPGVAITDPAVSSEFPRAVIDDSGAVTVAWWTINPSGGAPATLTAMRSSGSGWATPVALVSGYAASTPAMAVDGAGQVTMAWMGCPTAPACSIATARFAAGGWGAVGTLDDPGTSDVGLPRAAVDGTGNAFVTWTTGAAPAKVARAGVFAGGTWTTGTVSAAGEEVRNPHVAAGGTGATVMWGSGPDGTGAIRARRWAAGAWGDTSDLSAAGQQVNADSWDTQASNGSAVAIWLAPKGGNNIAQAVTFAVVPDAPPMPTLQPGNRSLAVTWVPPVDPGTTVTYTATATPGGRTCTAQSPAATCTITGLVNGRRYRVAVTAANSEGTSPASPQTAPTAPVGVPGAPRTVGARVVGTGRVAVAWRAPASNGGEPITGYVVRAAPSGRRCITQGRRTCVVTGLAAGRAYRFTVRARNGIGLGPRSAASRAVMLGVPGVTG